MEVALRSLLSHTLNCSCGCFFQPFLLCRGTPSPTAPLPAARGRYALPVASSQFVDSGPCLFIFRLLK